MKILVITNLFPNKKEPTRGVFNQQQILELAKLCELKVVAPVPWAPNLKTNKNWYAFSQVPRREQIKGIEIFHPRFFTIPKFGRSLYGPLFFFSLLNKVKGIYYGFKFDAIFVTWAYPDGFGSFLISKVLNKPIVIKVHGTDINVYTKYVLRRKMITLALKNCNKVISVSEDLKRRMIDIGVPEEKILVIPNGVDRELFKPMDKECCRRDLSLPASGKIILYVGNLCSIKNVEYLIEAFCEVFEKIKNAMLIIVGDGCLKKKLIKQVANAGLTGKVIFGGRRRYDEIPLWMNSSDVLALPSINEGCPNVVLEALACGKPVVASRVGGIPEIITSDDYGFLPLPRNYEELAKALRESLNKPWDYDKIRNKSLEFNWGESAKKIKMVIENSLKNPTDFSHNTDKLNDEDMDAALSGHDIVYFSNDWSADNRTSSRHIVDQLSQKNKILYVESSGLRVPSTNVHDIKRIFEKLKRFFYGPQIVRKNVYRFSPLLLPFHRYDVVQKINRILLVYSIRKVCTQLNFKRPILWVIIPHMASLIGSLNEKLVVYYCVDDFASLPGVESNIITQFDRELTKRADIVFTPSKMLYEKKIKVNKNTYLSPHGVDVKHFSKVLDDTIDIPKEISHIKKPILGFFGLIERWIDLNLIEYLAKYNENWSIIMIGRIAQPITKFKKITNVYFLGPRKYESLPNYARHFDVALIPYVLNKQVMNANPIKLREYLAMGKAIVSVRTPEIEKLADVVRISDGYESFARNVEIALNENSEKQIKKRTELVKDSSWESRFERISRIVSNYLPKI